MPFMQIIRGDSRQPQTKILCDSLEQKEKVKKMLKDKQFSFHTHSEPGNRVKLFVLKKYFYEELDVIKKCLEDREIPISKVSFLVNHKERPVYLIHSSDEELNIHALKKNHFAIGNLCVQWESFDLRRKRLMPSRKCKMWGHSAFNCNRPYRCIKCDQTHEPHECPRKDRNIGSPKCVNCSGDHPANSRNCPAYIKYLKSIERRRNLQSGKDRAKTLLPMNPQHNFQDRQRERQSEQQLRNHHQVQLPQFHERHQRAEINSSMNHGTTYAGVLGRSLNGNDSHDLFSLDTRFQNIPNIGRTLSRFAELIEKLETTEESRHLMLIMSYCAPQYDV
jgi:hypothetical protein